MSDLPVANVELRLLNPALKGHNKSAQGNAW